MTAFFSVWLRQNCRNDENNSRIRNDQNVFTNVYTRLFIKDKIMVKHLNNRLCSSSPR